MQLRFQLDSRKTPKEAIAVVAHGSSWASSSTVIDSPSTWRIEQVRSCCFESAGFGVQPNRLAPTQSESLVLPFFERERSATAFDVHTMGPEMAIAGDLSGMGFVPLKFYPQVSVEEQGDLITVDRRGRSDPFGKVTLTGKE